jgi:hypothetical protein
MINFFGYSPHDTAHIDSAGRIKSPFPQVGSLTTSSWLASMRDAQRYGLGLEDFLTLIGVVPLEYHDQDMYVRDRAKIKSAWAKLSTYEFILDVEDSTSYAVNSALAAIRLSSVYISELLVSQLAQEVEYYLRAFIVNFHLSIWSAMYFDASQAHLATSPTHVTETPEQPLTDIVFPIYKFYFSRHGRSK